MLARASLLVLALTACKTASSEDPHVAPVPLPYVSPPLATLGASCSAHAELAVDPCGTKARVSLMWDSNVPLVRATVPCRLERAERGDSHVESCIHEGRLYATEPCIPCRVGGQGTSIVAELAELTRAQALAVQLRLGLPAEEPLLGEAAWRRALSRAAS